MKLNGHGQENLINLELKSRRTRQRIVANLLQIENMNHIHINIRTYTTVSNMRCLVNNEVKKVLKWACLEELDFGAHTIMKRSFPASISNNRRSSSTYCSAQPQPQPQPHVSFCPFIWHLRTCHMVVDSLFSFGPNK